MTTRVKLAIALLAVPASLATAGCTLGGAAPPAQTIASGSAPASIAPGGPSASASASSGVAAPSPVTPVLAPSSQTVQRCHTRDLTGHVEGHGAGAGQRYAALGLTNKTSTTCRVYGYPGLQLVDGHGSNMPTTARRDASVSPTLLTVKPGQTVWATLHWTVVPADDEAADHCAPDAASLRVIPPDETTQLTMAFRYGAICQHGAITVGPFGLNRPADG